MFKYLMVILTSALAALKVLGFIGISWWWVFLPIWLPLMMVVAFILVLVAMIIKTGMAKETITLIKDALDKAKEGK